MKVDIRGMRAALAPFAIDKGAVSAVEFALVFPVFCLIFAGVTDFGGALYAKFSLDGAVSSAANFALLNAGNVGSAHGAALATNLATIMKTAQPTVSGSIVVNNGPSATLAVGVVTAGGTASNADLYYCPTGSGSSITWGAGGTSATAACAGGTIVGQFVTIAATRTYSPFFSSYGLIKNNTIYASAVVETK